jgi:putative redox protein
MADSIHTVLEFNPGAGGTAGTDGGYKIEILKENESARPYELLLMALGSCLYSTFEEVYQKKRLNCKSVSVDISGTKRDEIPKLLKECNIKFMVKGADKESGFEKSFELACKYCSIYQTLKNVAEMKPEIVFTE